MKKKNLIALMVGTLLLNPTIYADSKTTTPAADSTDSGSQVQKVIDDYKAYVSSTPKEIRDEIITFRKENVKIQKQKRELYQQLSQEAHDFLAKEQEYRKKLPLKQKKLINIAIPNEQPAANNDKAGDKK